MAIVKGVFVYMIHFSLLCLVLTLAYKDSHLGTTLVEDGGRIKLPESDLEKKYMKNTTQTWYLHADTGVWGLVFEKMSIEISVNCKHDYIEIHQLFNSSFQNTIPPTRFCGENKPSPFISITSQVEIRFVSDDIWEMEGFEIQAVHANSKDVLERKLKTDYTYSYAPQQSDNGSDNDHDAFGGKIFYSLVGSSVAAFILFGGLLTYFILSLKRQNNPITRLPDLYYISDTVLPTAPHCAKPMAGMTKQGGAGKLQKKYTRDKSNVGSSTTEAKMSNLDETFSKEINSPGSSSHHNNLYISNFKVRK